MDLLTLKHAANVEVKLKPGNSRIETITNQIQEELNDYFNKENNLSSGDLVIIKEHGPTVQAHVESISVDWDYNSERKPTLIYHIYRPHKREVEIETFQEDGDTDGEVPASNHWLLPSHSFCDLWENLIFEENLKENLLQYAKSSLLFSQHGVNQNVISCNRIILLHGPPGTGKTSLCKALAQKLSIRLMSKYKYTHLIEINSHSLFSKWFSESGKLVMKLFSKVRDIIAQPQSLVCVLIDEVESIAYSRDSMSGQEPKDAMRVVNALLTQLDSIKNHPNVLILATSNLASNIDLAFLDRADVRQYIGLPSQRAIFQIYTSMLQELMRVKIIEAMEIKDFREKENILLPLVEMSVGVSGRTLRKLPFLAHAMHLQQDTSYPIDLKRFIEAVKAALETHLQNEMILKNNKN